MEETATTMEETPSSHLQAAVEADVKAIYQRDLPSLLAKDAHVAWLEALLLPDRRKPLSSGFSALDASRPWLLYWTLHAYSVLGQRIPDSVCLDVIAQLRTCWHARDGGFGGGPGQAPHLAATYAATLTIATLGTSEAYALVDRAMLLRFLLSMKQADGSFTMCDGGEVDVRGSYCALCSALLYNVLIPELRSECTAFIQQCQTYEGGFGARPGEEAHGGYTFCALAALCLIGAVDVIDQDALLFWASHRQMAVEGGFQGRTHKLVDGCYSFWQGGLFPLFRALRWSTSLCCNSAALRKYILQACQELPHGGLRDKPGKRADYYHTCYCLSGLASLIPNPACVDALTDATTRFGLPERISAVEGSAENLTMIHPIVNITLDKYALMMAFHHALPVVSLASIDCTRRV